VRRAYCLCAVALLGWLVFAELPVGEAYAPLYQALARSGALLLAGLALAFLAALVLARRMVVPIQTIRAGPLASAAEISLNACR
jgi:hypothetical protein